MELIGQITGMALSGFIKFNIGSTISKELTLGMEGYIFTYSDMITDPETHKDLERLHLVKCHFKIIEIDAEYSKGMLIRDGSNFLGDHVSDPEPTILNKKIQLNDFVRLSKSDKVSSPLERKIYYLIVAFDRQETWYEYYVLSKLFDSQEEAEAALPLYESHYRHVRIHSRDTKE